jgi:hypothetical protein
MRTARAAVTIAVLTTFILSAGCGGDGPPKKPEAAGGHKAAHDGCLNVIGECETGHAEVKVEGDVLRLWFVGGGSDTGRAVRVPEKEIVLNVKIDGQKESGSLALKAKPNQLAEEKEGDCSCFEGRADWLKGVKGFEAEGRVTFKGKPETLKIDYPHGHDPGHEAAGGKHQH